MATARTLAVPRLGSAEESLEDPFMTGVTLSFGIPVRLLTSEAYGLTCPMAS